MNLLNGVADIGTNIMFSLHIFSAILFLLFAVSCPSKVAARGRLMEPPQRSSLFSRGFNSPENYDDSALNCGGFWVCLLVLSLVWLLAEFNLFTIFMLI